MICKLCGDETDRKTRYIPCCRKCNEHVSSKRDEMVEERKRLEQVFLDDPTSGEKIKDFYKAPEGSIKNAMNEIYKEYTNPKKVEKEGEKDE